VAPHPLALSARGASTLEDLPQAASRLPSPVSVAVAAAGFTIEARCNPHAIAKSVTAAVLL